MQVAHHRIGLGNDFAIEFQHQAQHAVGGRMGGSHIERELLTNDIGSGLLAGFELEGRSGRGVERFNLSCNGRHGEASRGFGSEYPTCGKSGNSIL